MVGRRAGAAGLSRRYTIARSSGRRHRYLRSAARLRSNGAAKPAHSSSSRAAGSGVPAAARSCAAAASAASCGVYLGISADSVEHNKDSRRGKPASAAEASPRTRGLPCCHAAPTLRAARCVSVGTSALQGEWRRVHTATLVQDFHIAQAQAMPPCVLRDHCSRSLSPSVLEQPGAALLHACAPTHAAPSSDPSDDAALVRPPCPSSAHVMATHARQASMCAPATSARATSRYPTLTPRACSARRAAL